MEKDNTSSTRFKFLPNALRNERLRQNFLQALPFWIASLITGLIAVSATLLGSFSTYGRGRRPGPLAQYVMPGNCSRARSSWLAHSRGQPKARAACPLRSAAAAPLVKWTYSPQFIRRV